MKYISFIASIILLSACSNERIILSDGDEISGHIIFTHAGEENKPVSPFSITTLDDSTIYNYRRRYLELYKDGKEDETSYFDSRFTNTFGDDSSKIERVNADIYKQIKEKLMLFAQSDSTKGYFESYSAFECLIIDTSDSLSFIIHKGEPSYLLYLDLLRLAAKHELKKTENHFMKCLTIPYKEHQNILKNDNNNMEIKYRINRVSSNLIKSNDFDELSDKSFNSKNIKDKQIIDSLITLINRLPRDISNPYLPVADCQIKLHIQTAGYAYSDIYIGKYQTNIFSRNYINTVEFVNYLNKLVYQ